jgi:hypothetical protein
MTIKCMGEFIFMLNLHLCVLQNFLKEGPLHFIHLYNVILDEAHIIKVFYANTSQVVFQLTIDHC